jgi:hypothetical protein
MEMPPPPIIKPENTETVVPDREIAPSDSPDKISWADAQASYELGGDPEVFAQSVIELVRYPDFGMKSQQAIELFRIRKEQTGDNKTIVEAILIKARQESDPMRAVAFFLHCVPMMDEWTEDGQFIATNGQLIADSFAKLSQWVYTSQFNHESATYKPQSNEFISIPDLRTVLDGMTQLVVDQIARIQSGEIDISKKKVAANLAMLNQQRGLLQLMKTSLPTKEPRRLLTNPFVEEEILLRNYN